MLSQCLSTEYSHNDPHPMHQNSMSLNKHTNYNPSSNNQRHIGPSANKHPSLCCVLPNCPTPKCSIPSLHLPQNHKWQNSIVAHQNLVAPCTGHPLVDYPINSDNCMP